MLTYARKQGKRKLDIPELKAKLLKGSFESWCSYAIERNRGYSRYGEPEPDLTEDETQLARNELKDKVLLYGLFESDNQEDSNVSSTGWFYSFCRGGWQEGHCTVHCDPCGQCGDWREWHCTRCNTCNDGLSIPCETCGGVSSMYHGMDKHDRDW